MKKLSLALIALLFILVGCGKKETPSEVTKVRIGLSSADSVVWKYIAEEAAKENIEIEIVAFSDYSLPNNALANKELELNAFQHLNYLNKEVEQFGYELTPIGKTVIAPMGIYPGKASTLEELKDGDTIAIPNDQTNGGRALQLLAANGLIELNDEPIPSIKDITANPRNFEILELAATNIPGTLQDVAVAAINSGVATDAGLDPVTKSIVLEEVDINAENPFVNLIVARTEDKDNAVYKRIVEIYQTDKVKELIKEDSKGASIPVW